jgi:D-amino-acid dehydrogenase
MNNDQRNSNQGKQVAVLGAGIIGVNCALELQSLGFQVTLFDKSDVGEGCSKGNAGHFATEQVFPLAEVSLLWQLPKLLLDPLGPIALPPRYFPKALSWFLRFIANMLVSKRARNSAALKSLNRHAIEYYKPLLRAAKAEHLMISKGSLLVFESQRQQHALKIFNHYKKAGIAVKLLDRAQTLSLEPNLSKKVNYSLYFTDVAHTSNPHLICQILAEQALKIGTCFLKAEVINIHCLQQSVRLDFIQQKHNQNTDTATSKRFDQIVIATGAWSKVLVEKLGYQLPIEAERGYSLDLAQTNTACLTRPVVSAERKFIMTPMAHGLRLAGTSEFAGLKQAPNMKRANMLYKNAVHLLTNIPKFDENIVSPEQQWLGFRPSLPDSLPVIGRAPKHNNVLFALGHQHLGLTLGAITGKLIGQLMTEQKTDVDLKPFCISRFN